MKKMIRKLSVLFMAFIMTIGVIASTAAYADEDEYVYGTVNMNYADFYYGELEGIEPSADTTIDTEAEDPVTKAGYREEGFYDAATFATPRGFIYEKKWQDGYPGTYNEPIIDEFGNLVGGKILGVEAVNVAVKKSVYDAAKAAPDSVIGKKAAEIKLNEDQSQVPLSYKVLNADGVYSKYVNLTEAVNVDLDGYLTTEFMGDDIWWEGHAMKHTKDQTILGGVIEYKKDPLDASEKPVVLGLKHDENMYSDTWIGWGMGPGNVGIYGGNETGWQRFEGISGNYLTKMSYILMEKDGSVHYYNASYNPETDTEGKQMKDLLHPYVPSSVVENGIHPYSAGITDYEFTKDRIKLDLAISVPLRADGTREADYYLYSVNCPGGTASKARHESNPEQIPVFEESEWENGRKTYHIEINRKYTKEDGTTGYYGTGRYKFWFDVNPDYEKKDGDRYFTGVAAWKMLYTKETPNDIYLQNGKLVVDSEIFSVEDYINNPYQQVEVYNADTNELEDIFATGDANTNTTLFAGTKTQNGAEVKGLFNADGSIFLGAQKYSYNRRSGLETLTPVFSRGKGAKYNIILYSGGFPIIQGTVEDTRTAQEVKTDVTSLNMKYGDDPAQITAQASTDIIFSSSNAKVATVDKDGKVTAVGAGTCKINVIAAPSDQFLGGSAEVDVTVEAAPQEITAPDTLKFTIGDAAKALEATALTELAYESDKAEVATVDETGLVTPVAAGSCTIKITAAGTAQYQEAVKEVKVTVSLKKPKITTSKKLFKVGVKKLKKKARTVTFKAKTNSGGKLTYSGKGTTVKARKALKIAKTGKITVKKGTKKGLYKINVTVKCAKKGNFAAATKKFVVSVRVK